MLYYGKKNNNAKDSEKKHFGLNLLIKLCKINDYDLYYQITKFIGVLSSLMYFQNIQMI